MKSNPKLQGRWCAVRDKIGGCIVEAIIVAGGVRLQTGEHFGEKRLTGQYDMLEMVDNRPAEIKPDWNEVVRLMNAPVHILATVRKMEMINAATLVFKTLRVGFPNAQVFVWGNGLSNDAAAQVSAAAAEIGAPFTDLNPTCHDLWIERLVLNQTAPYWICDTDIVFFDKCEGWFEDEIFAGRLEPTWVDPWSKTACVERLHTCLQWHNPAAIRSEMLRWSRQNVPQVFSTGQIPFIRQHFMPGRTGTTLYDSTCGLWQSGIGTPFSDHENSCFEHLHCGTYVDEVGQCGQYRHLREVHDLIYSDPNAARGMYQKQKEFYARQALTI